MKIHRTLADAVINTLQRIFSEGVYADKAVEQVLKQNARWGSRDRRFIAETSYEMVRWWRLITETAQIKPENSSDYWLTFGVWQIIKGEELPDWNEFQKINKEEVLARCAQLRKERKYLESIPDWLDTTGSKELGDLVWTKELNALNKEARVVLRVNTLKTELQKLQRTLSEQGIETSVEKEYPDGLVLQKRQNLHQLKEYKDGLFEIQDASSQLIAPFLDLSPGMTVIDACAGAGGKSLHIAAMMKNKGKIISMDVEERKLQELTRRSERAGVKMIQTQLIHPSNIAKLKNSADRLLLDVPCSGLGVLRRNPDAKWKLNPEFIEHIKTIQQQIICDYSSMLKNDGIMVYATCSILPSENQDQVMEFLEKNPNFELLADRKVLPTEGFDGFYMAKIRRKV